MGDSPLHHGVSLLRSTSRAFTGGAANIPDQGGDVAPTETTPLRRGAASRHIARQTQAQLQQRVTEEFHAWIMGRLIWFILLGIVVVALVITMAVLWILAALAVVNNYQKPCDQPLKWYLLAGFVWSHISSLLFKSLPDVQDGVAFHIGMTLLCNLPGWALMGWGIYMTTEAKTCQQTNPGLFFPTKNFIIGQVIFACWIALVGLVFALGFRRLLAFTSSLVQNPGCETAVHKLPKVEPGDKELVDEEDGEATSCVICLEELSEEGNVKRTKSMLAPKPSAILRTPCSHFFHEDCLATWCKNHVDCPICRAQIGEADPIEVPGEP